MEQLNELTIQLGNQFNSVGETKLDISICRQGFQFSMYFYVNQRADEPPRLEKIVADVWHSTFKIS